MKNIIKRRVAPCREIRNGIALLTELAISTYGAKRCIQYKKADGNYESTASFGDILKYAVFSNEEISRAVAIFKKSNPPMQGIKTSLIILNSILNRAEMVGCNEEEWNRISEILDYGVEYTMQIASENNDQVVGGGLTFLTLCRPIRKYGLTHKCELPADIVSYSFEQPLLKLAEAAGFDEYEVFERVKAMAPNQFFSLNQVGIENSINTDVKHTDYIKVGLDIENKKIQDLQAAGIVENVDISIQVLQFVKRGLNAVLEIAGTL